MSIVTTQQLARYFEQYKATEVTFNKQVLAATGLVTKNVYLKVLDRQWPCVVFSSSMAAARVIVNVKEAFLTALRKANNRPYLRWCFKVAENPEPIAFYVSCHPAGFTPYDPQNAEVQLLTLEYTQRPPERSDHHPGQPAGRERERAAAQGRAHPDDPRGHEEARPGNARRNSFLERHRPQGDPSRSVLSAGQGS